MEIIVVDHLPCKNNELGLCTGMSPQGVSEFGRSLRDCINLQQSGISVIFCSNLRRAIDTVQLCFGDWRIPVIYDPRLCAINYGHYQDRLMSEILSIQHEYIDRPFPEGESYVQMADRYRSFFDEMAIRFHNDKSIVIGHYGTREILHHFTSETSLQDCFGRQLRNDTVPRHVAIRHYFENFKFVRFNYPRSVNQC